MIGARGMGGAGNYGGGRADRQRLGGVGTGTSIGECGMRLECGEGEEENFRKVADLKIRVPKGGIGIGVGLPFGFQDWGGGRNGRWRWWSKDLLGTRDFGTGRAG